MEKTKLLILLSLPVLMVLNSNCAKSKVNFYDSPCSMILIEGPYDISVGETAVLKVVGYDEGYKRVTKRIFAPTWSMQKEGVIEIISIDNDIIKIRGIKKGNCNLKASMHNIVSEIAISVK